VQFANFGNIIFTCTWDPIIYVSSVYYQKKTPVLLYYSINILNNCRITWINSNVTQIGITLRIIFYVTIDLIHSHRRVRRFYKNKFELDRSDHDSHATRAERYLV